MAPELVFLIVRVLLALLLYGFLGLVLLALWRDFRSSASVANEPPETYLAVENGPRHKLRPSSEIGRAAGNVVRIDDETISALHARLMYHGGQWWIEDLASRNGTEVNGIPVTEPMVVTGGDEIQMGRVVLQLEYGQVDRELARPRTIPNE